MAFEKDVFISYAHIDNLPLREGEKGWIESFHRALDVRLAQLMGETPRIWRDQKLQGNDYFGDEILEQFPRTAIMISILSPRYLKSEWCTREVREFYRTAAGSDGVKIGNKSRIFKVIKTAVPYDAHPPEIVDTLGYEFYVTEPLTGRIRELEQQGGELEQVYWTKLDDVAHDISDLLARAKNQKETGGITGEEPSIQTNGQGGQTTVYLAETSSQINEQRDLIKRELTQFGYRVVPDCRMPIEASQFTEAVTGFLEQSSLAVHMIGEKYGMVPEEATESIVALQNRLAARMSADKKLSRLIWMLPGCNPDDDRQKEFVRHIRTDTGAQLGADLYETSIEEFKAAVHDTLTRIQTGDAGQEQAKPDTPPMVYLICDRLDIDNITQIEDFLYDNGCDVTIPVFEGREDDLARDHREMLKTCDAVLIYYGQGSELWMRSVVRDLTKAAGYGRTRPLTLKAAVMAEPVTRAKQRFRAHDILVIDGNGGFSAESLEPFLEILKVQKG